MVVPAPTIGTASSNGSTAPVFDPFAGSPAAPNSSGAVPGAIGGSGASGAVPPISILPAPQESQSKIQEMIDRYGMRTITGSGSTPDVLGRMDEAYRRLPAGSFRNLDVCVETQYEQGSNGSSGVWNSLDANNTPREGPGAAAVAGRIVYYGQDADAWLYIHEVVHHVSILLDARFGLSTTETLGYRASTNRGNDVDTMDFGEFTATSVTEESYPTNYARKEAQEHVADIVPLYLLGSGPDVLPTFRMPDAVRSVLSSKLGSGGGA